MSEKKKQAVVIIHGIGEQRPILTLRGFVEPLAEHLKKIRRQAREDESIFWEKPDPVSGNYETRKMVMRQGRDHPSTHFYEFYWAHHLRDTRFSHISAWLNRVVLRWPGTVSPRLLPVYFFLWFLIIVILTAIGFFAWSGDLPRLISFTTGVIGSVLLAVLSNILFNYLGDAARYLDPAPGNIGERQAIRAEGMALLKGLHESGEYDRIIIVAHSLGTAIAYDLVKLLWAEYYYKNDAAAFAIIPDPDLARHFKNLDEAVANAAALDGTAATRNAFRKSQSDSFAYLKDIGNPWLVTDLVTLGSPLAHAGHLFAQEKGLFEKLKEQREYPMDPPYVQPPDKNWILEKKTAVHPNGAMMKYFNHSSPYAVTRWTNIYYNSDFIGGPVADLFGKGIEDIEIFKGAKIFAYPAGHTTYWDYANKKNVLEKIWTILEDKAL